MLLLAPIMSNIPLAALAGVLIVTAIRMNEWTTIKYYFKHKFKSAIALFSLTLIFTVVFDLSLAIITGFVMGLLIFVVHNSHVEINSEKVDLHRLKIEKKNPEKWSVIYITGPLFFMTADKLKHELEKLSENQIVIFSIRGVPSIDNTALNVIRDFTREQFANKKRVIFAGLSKDVKLDFDRSEFSNEIGKIYFSVDKVLMELINETN
jgi:SulP family sulfate permease